MIEEVRKQVFDLLNQDNSGHGMDHIERVVRLSLKFAEQEKADKEVVWLVALPHDVDDYKLFGSSHSENLTNAKKIMSSSNVDIQEKVLSAIKTIGYGKRLKGITPDTLEAKIVSDADMCDGLGVNGILRTNAYSMKKKKPFFDKNIFPTENITSVQYTSKTSDSSICYIFEKILKLKDLMLTESGKEEAKTRHQIVIDILYHFFEEEDVPEWTEYLNKYLANDMESKIIPQV